MSRLIHELLQEERRLNYLIEALKKSLNEAPDGNLRISRCGKSVQYYIKPGKSNIFAERPADELGVRYLHTAANALKSEKGIYVRKGEEKLAFDIAQRDYDSALFKLSEKRLRCVQSLLEQCRNDEMEKVYDKLKPLRRAIVKPRILTDERFAEKWSDVQYEGKIFEEGTAVIYTNRGERVRSKSEKIIADMLFQKGVPYRYEAPFAMRGIGMVYPDFTVLNIGNREELYWEHFGMMDNKEYCVRALRKIEYYQKNGFFPGKKLITTYETSQYPLETETIERNIAEYCLD